METIETFCIMVRVYFFVKMKSIMFYFLFLFITVDGLV